MVLWGLNRTFGFSAINLTSKALSNKWLKKTYCTMYETKKKQCSTFFSLLHFCTILHSYMFSLAYFVYSECKKIYYYLDDISRSRTSVHLNSRYNEWPDARERNWESIWSFAKINMVHLYIQHIYTLYTHTCIYTYIYYLYIYAHIYIHIHILYIRLYMYKYKHVYIYVHMHISIDTLLCTSFRHLEKLL